MDINRLTSDTNTLQENILQSRPHFVKSILSWKILLLILFLVSFRPSFSQTDYSNNPNNATLHATKHGAFEDYAFVLNGKVIKPATLLNNPGSRLSNVFPYAITLNAKRYLGAVYFHTPQGDAPPSQGTNEPAFFINDRQVSSKHALLTRPEDYTHIQKSAKDTLIAGKLYKGAIQIYTEENFFANRIGLPDLIKKYTGLPENKVIVHWRSSRYQYRHEENLGTIIKDSFPLYYFENSHMGIKAIEVDSICLAEGVQYVVHLVDNQYQHANPKAAVLLADPMLMDTLAPCYVTDFAPEEHTIFISTEIQAEPRGGIAKYLKRISGTMGINAVKAPHPGLLDSVSIQFIVMRDGRITALQSISPPSPEQQKVLTAIKKNSCAWLPALQGGRTVHTWRLMKIVYTKNKKGAIQTLNRMVYKQMPSLPPIPYAESKRFVNTPVSIDTASLFPKVYGNFEDYTFIVNGTTIDRSLLANYPNARLGRIISNNTEKKNTPKGVVYFNTSEYPPSPADEYADDPAYFINDRQVSPYAIRSTDIASYNYIRRSKQDTMINGVLYTGTVRVYTDEDFFSHRLNLSEIVKKYTELSMDKVMVHWRGQYVDYLNTGLIIHDNFPLYYIDPRGLNEIKIDRIQFAEGERYLVRVFDKGYRSNVFTEKN